MWKDDATKYSLNNYINKSYRGHPYQVECPAEIYYTVVCGGK